MVYTYMYNSCAFMHACMARGCTGGNGAKKVRIANFDLTWELRHRNGIQIIPAGNTGKNCPCRATLRHKDAGEDACGDALLAKLQGMLVMGVTIVYALVVTCLQGTVATGTPAEVGGAAAAMGEHWREDEYCCTIGGSAYDCGVGAW
jgi:hypothetical protein